MANIGGIMVDELVGLKLYIGLLLLCITGSDYIAHIGGFSAG